MDSKVCLTTFVYGMKYQNYIPLLIYSIKKAYPEYAVKIFVYNELKKSIKKKLLLLKVLGDFEIKEKQFSELNISNPLEARLARWILPYENFQKFDYLYIIDIDMFYIREPIALHKQHIAHMEYLELPFSNIIRNYNEKAMLLKPIYHRLRDVGFANFFKFINSGVLTAKQLSGLHFVKIHPYFDIVREKQNELKQIIYSKSYKKNIINNDEVFLYDMIKNSGFNMSRLGIMKNPINMLDFNNPQRAEFRPHHGIHLGIFRTSYYSISTENILKSKEYLYYVDNFKKLLDDKLLISLLDLSGKKIKKILKRMFDYYNIKY